MKNLDKVDRRVEKTRNAIISICVVFLSIALIGVVMKLLRSFVKSYATNMMTSKVVSGFFNHVIDLLDNDVNYLI